MNKRLLTLAVSAVLLGNVTQVQAAGFQLAEYSATGLGRAFAGEAAMADNASAQFRNPAMLTYLEGTQVSGGLILVVPSIDIHGEVTYNDVTSPTSAEDIADAAAIPNFYASHQLNDKWFIGLALGSNFGMATELDDDFRGTQYGDEASVTTIEFNPNVAYRINDQFSIGGGVRFIWGEGSIGAQSSIDTVIPTPLGNITVPKGTSLKYMEGDDTSWGWQLGGAWQINADHRIGLNYRSGVEQNLEGEANGFAFNPFNPTQTMAGSMELELPATAELASFHQLTEKLAIHASINWTDWSSFEQLVAVIPSLDEPNQLVKQENWEDNYRFAVGTTYQLNDTVTMRAGVALDKSAVSDANRTLTIPEMDRLWLSAGMNYKVNKNFDMDLGLTYIFADESPVVEPRPGIPSDDDSAYFGGTFTGTTSGNIFLVGVQTTYRF
ncbi:outer membrane protein transport protein [Shewanella youngdeokensis]|uniref:Outer membrane protein transport protein n=1 Tax=Shewanella youngdeokensis TaxID=2999068 RepID=A0ABZ0JXH0_9GAMM|nr:outer membrane protein transport protein [Shewanella sp. DAU334]